MVLNELLLVLNLDLCINTIIFYVCTIYIRRKNNFCYPTSADRSHKKQIIVEHRSIPVETESNKRQQ